MRADCSAEQRVTLGFKDGAFADANRALLSAASPVLRHSLELPLPPSGVLPLGEEAAEDWEVVLRMLSLAEYPPLLVDWDNVDRLLKIASKYDMALVRGTCAHFLAQRAGGLTLAQPLTSARNLLRAASLVEAHCGGSSELAPYQQQLLRAIDREVRVQLGSGKAADVDRLLLLADGEQYSSLVAPDVQAAVLRATLRVLCSRALPEGHAPGSHPRLKEDSPMLSGWGRAGVR